VSCKNEHDLPPGQWGIKVLELGPWKLQDGKHWEYRYVPVPTSQCDLCADRVSKGEQPACVLHCLASCMEYGTMEELAKKMETKGKMATILLP
jgi:Fe-S-cluster-containing dehydrogenase component